MSDLVRAVYHAADNGARVINMSFTMTVEARNSGARSATPTRGA